MGATNMCCYNIRYLDKEKGKEMTIPLEKMVGILLYSEINLEFHIEALKAQAVIIRTNLLKSPKNIEGTGLKDIWDCEDEGAKRAIKAVEDTKGLAITFNEKLIDAKYHLVCGGSTDNSENVMNNQVIYLRRVLCDYCKHSPYWEKEVTFSIEEIQELLDVKFPKENIDTDTELTGFIEEIKKDDYGRVRSVKIGNESFSGRELMELLSLDSTRFSIYPIGVKFITRGKGHGVGLCQYGANRMAEEGYSFKDILKYYYTGVQIEKVALPCIKMPLYGKVIVIDPGHGGDDKGHKGNHLGLLEKNIVLNMSLKLKSKLDDLGATVHLTRDTDENILITRRLEQVNDINPNFFISIHMDYYPNSNMKGVEIFHFRNDEESKKLGLCIIDSLNKNQIPIRGVKEGNFFIFRGVSSSSMMVEIGYLSSLDEEIMFNDDKYLNKLANGIVKGILEYFAG